MLAIPAPLRAGDRPRHCPRSPEAVASMGPGDYRCQRERRLTDAANLPIAVIEAGPDAIAKAGNQLRDLEFLFFGERSRDIDLNIVRATLARWRAWGQMILRADESAI